MTNQFLIALQTQYKPLLLNHNNNQYKVKQPDQLVVMSRTILFGGNTTAQTRSQYLVEFRAGKMTQNGNTVSPVKGRKGLVYLHQSTEDSLMHFCWKDRQSGQIEDDLIIFPDEAEFKRVSQCTTGRVFVLKFKPSSRRFFYWSQEPKEDKDDDWVTKINDYINNPPAPGSRSSTGAAGGGGSGGLSPASALADLSSLPESDLQGLLNNMSPQQFMSVLGGVGGMGSASLASLLGAATGASRNTTSSAATSQVSTPAAPQTPATTPAVVSAATSESSLTTATGTPPTGAAKTGDGAAAAALASSLAPGIQLADLQSIISGLNVPSSLREGDGLNVDLSSSLTLEALQPLLSNKEFMRRVREALPPGTESSGSVAADDDKQTSAVFASTVQSPQFQQALSTFSSALQSGQLGPLIHQFALGQECVDAANAGDMESFVKALQKQQSKDGSKGGAADTTTKDDEMALD